MMTPLLPSRERLIENRCLGLRTIMGTDVDIMYEAPSHDDKAHTIRITESCVLGKEKPKIERQEAMDALPEPKSTGA